MHTPQKFLIQTVFDGEGDVIASAPPPRKRIFTPEEVEAVRQAAFRDGEASAIARAEAEKAAAMGALAHAAEQALTTLANAAHAHKEEVAGLALAAAQVIAGGALEVFPEAPVRAAVESLSREIETAPRLTLRASQITPELESAVTEIAQSVGFPGRLVLKPASEMRAGAFVLEWGDGQAAYDPAEAAGRVAEALREALAAEGLHGEALNHSREDF
jgi:flagellar assembly protein FliH